MISIIIPAYNEHQNIPLLLEKISKSLKNEHYEVIIVDDDSPDKTWQAAKKLAKKYPVHVLRRKNKKGLSSAVLDGFKIAKGDILGVMDADLSHPPEKIPELIKSIRKGYDFVIGSRLVKGGKAEKWPASRRLVSFSARCLARPLTSVKDPMSGFFFIRRKVIKNRKFTPRGYKIALELIVKGNYSKIKEVPIIFRNRKKGKSKLSIKVQIDYIRQLIGIYLYKIKK